MTASLSFNGYPRTVRAVFSNLLAIAVLACCVGIPALAQTTSTWTGGSGEWAPCPNNGGNALWDTCNANPPQYPDGNYNAVIQGGPVTLSGTDGDTIVNLTLGSGSSVDIVGGYVFIAGNSIANNGTISITNGNGLALIGQGATVTLSGSGTVNMTSSLSTFDGTAGSNPTLINQQTIMGQGTLGKEGFSIQNQGTINAVGGTLTVQPSSAGIINTGTFEASSGATLDIVYGFLGPFNNTGGTIKALDGGTVQLQGEIYTGGTLTTVGSGVIQLTGGTVLNGLTNSGLVQVSSNVGDLQNTVTNTGTIQLVSGTLSMLGSVTLTGSGSLIMSGTSQLNQNSAGGSLINQQLIHGAGTVYELPLTNQGTIEADNTSATLSLAGGATTNTATLEASGGGTLDIYSDEKVNNSGGIIQALTGSTVLLEGTVSGGTLKTSGSGVIEGKDGTIDGTVNVLTNSGKLSVPTGYNLNLPDVLKKCICSVHRGQVWASSNELRLVLEKLRSALPSQLVDFSGKPLLSKREQDVVRGIAEGMTNREIAEHLKLSAHTVKNHVFKIFDRLGVSSRVEVVLYAMSQASQNRRQVAPSDDLVFRQCHAGAKQVRSAQLSS